LFRPDIPGDIFYLDLDTLVIAPLDDVANAGRLTMLRDFYRPERPASGVMYLPEVTRWRIWEEWIKYGPDNAMRDFAAGGDQAFLGTLDPIKRTAHFQDLFQDQIISYKAHMRVVGRRG